MCQVASVINMLVTCWSHAGHMLVTCWSHARRHVLTPSLSLICPQNILYSTTISRYTDILYSGSVLVPNLVPVSPTAAAGSESSPAACPPCGLLQTGRTVWRESPWAWDDGGRSMASHFQHTGNVPCREEVCVKYAYTVHVDLPTIPIP